MSKAKEIIEMSEGLLKMRDLFKVFKKVDPVEWSGFLASLQNAIRETNGTVVTTEDLRKAFTILRGGY
jgi:hypothetical protein